VDHLGAGAGLPSERVTSPIALTREPANPGSRRSIGLAGGPHGAQ
jgi:hypothetical protein